MRDVLRTILAALLLAPACFSPAFDDGQFTCPTGDCPPGFECERGVCVRDPSAAPIDAAPATDVPAATPDAATPTPDAATFDARPPQPARVYVNQEGHWSAIPASIYFAAAGAPEPALIQTAWTHCASEATYCFGTDERWHCTDDFGTTWYSNSWEYLDDMLEPSPPTFSTAFDEEGFLDSVLFSSAALWWRFASFVPPRDDSTGTGLWNLNLTSWHGDDASSDHDTEWDEELNAPPSASAITADFRTDGDWTLWDLDGIEYRRGAAGWLTPEPAELLATEGAPPADLVVAAATCDKRIIVITRATD